MSFVERFKYDLFISYAHADDAPDASGCKWVSAFVTHLDRALRQRLGGPKSLDIFFDSHHLHPNNQLDSLLEAVRTSAIFLAVASRSYANRDWTREELAAFAAPMPDFGRLFAIEYLPLDAGDAYPAPLELHYRKPFFRGEGVNGSLSMPVSPIFDARAFNDLVHDVAEKIRLQLISLKRGPTAGTADPARLPASASRGTGVPDAAPVPAATITPPSDPRSRRVLLAQVTDDLEDNREQVRRYLEQFGIEVLPGDVYPQGGADFARAFTDDLERADLFVQLLGASPGRRPRDLPQGYTRFQHEAAGLRGVRILQWRRPDLDLETVDNLEHRAFLNGQTVIATGLESFKEEIRGLAQRPAQVPESRKSQAGFVFIDAAQQDLPVAERIRDEFGRYDLSSFMPLSDGTSEEVRLDLEENFRECDALVLVYGETPGVWVRGQARMYSKHRSERKTQPKGGVIFAGPPEKQSRLGISIAGLDEIYCGDAWDMERLRPLIDELRG